MRCGKCTASCPPNEDADIHPHKFVKNVEEGNIEALMQSKMLWKCLSCLACVERCPRGVEPAALLEAVRVAVLREQGGSYLMQDEVPQIVEFDEEIPQQLIVSMLRKYNRP
jgi:heterodisulfide reductase subunit C